MIVLIYKFTFYTYVQIKLQRAQSDIQAAGKCETFQKIQLATRSEVNIETNRIMFGWLVGGVEMRVREEKSTPVFHRFIG